MYCYRHPNVETNLRCGKCDKYICPKCTVSTPVGARCPDCAKLTKLPVFEASKSSLLRAAGIGVGLAIGFGILWGIIAPHLWGLSFIGALLVGYGIGELLSRAVSRKRTVGLQIIAGASVAICYLIAILAFDLIISIYGLVGIAIGIYLAVSQFR